MPAKIDITGQRFGRLVALEEAPRLATSICAFPPRRFLFRCDCGSTPTIDIASVRSGNTSSCGCLKTENQTKHGDHKTHLYFCWRNIKSRCLTPGTKNYDKYGARGIFVCKEWLDYEVFKKWALASGYVDGMTIDRIDAKNGYSPDNCRWLTLSDNSSFTSRAMKISYGGSVMSLRRACVLSGKPYRKALNSIKNGENPFDSP